MKVGILGLGLIGGSLARAYALDGHTVLACEKDESILSFAMLAGAVHGKLDESTIPSCDLILLAIYPGGSASWLEDNAPLIGKKALVLDCCGIKREICQRCFPVAEKYGFTFV
ncbi:MAG: NAD(P)-binding domain-containing protein, partial [Oscillospiraceae bacterium]|nr:NAD(P)-binding domain-containing protein [Oscillospiraceae bacterium]